MSHYCRPHGPRHTRLLCPSLSLRVCSNSCLLNWSCHPTISSSLAPFSFCLQSFKAWGSFPVNQLFPSSGQSIGASAKLLPVNIQGWFPLGLTGLISLESKGLSRVFFSTTIWKISSLALSLLYGPISHPYIATGKAKALTIWTFISKVMSVLFNILSRFVIAFLPRSKHLLILWLLLCQAKGATVG